MEKFSNNAITSLSANISSSDTVIPVASVSDLPTSGQFRLEIDDELTLITNISGLNLIGQRGIEGTSAVSHSSGALCYQVLTTGGIQQLVKDISSFEFDQASPATTWNINHPLNRFPAVVVVDSAGTVVIGEVIYIDSSNVQLKFSSAFSGTAYLN